MSWWRCKRQLVAHISQLRPRSFQKPRLSSTSTRPLTFALASRSTSSHPLRSVCFRSMSFNASAPRERTYDREVDVEDFEEYSPGGYHPVVIGDTFHDGRYHVVHKLGYGGYSTIWLARDQLRNRSVSLKILLASGSENDSEGEILRYLSDGDSWDQGKRFIPLLLEEFSIKGPNGRHSCLVQEPAGCSIPELKENSTNFMFPAETARSIAAQLIMGLSYIHAHGVCHAGMYDESFRRKSLTTNISSRSPPPKPPPARSRS